MTIKKALNPLRSPTTAVVGFALLVLIAIGAKARVWRNVGPATGNPQQLLPAASGPAEMVRFTLYDAGIFPSEARVSAGQVVIYIDDVSGDSAGLVVQSEAKAVLGQVVRGARQSRGGNRMSFVPGRYQVFDASRPKNRATLVVEP